MTDVPKASIRRSFSLAAKITLPFVVLFALLLLSLGVVLAREILAEVETRVESRQRFILKVATFRFFPHLLTETEEFLQQLKEGAAEVGTDGAEVRSEFVVLQDQKPPLTTFANAEQAHQTAETLAANIITSSVRTARAKLGPQASRADLAKELDVALATLDEPLYQNALEEAQAGVKAAGAASESNGPPLVMSLGDQKWLALYRDQHVPGAARRHFFLLYPYAEIAHAQDRALWRLISLGALGILLAAGLGLLVAQWVSRPVRRLAANALQISTGGLNAAQAPAFSGDVRRRDEIGELSLALQSMLDSLRRSQQELLKSERLAVTGKLAASVAHEIRNPLTSLRMTLEMLRKRAPAADTAAHEAYQILLSEIDRLALAVEELLTFARPRPPQREPVDLNALARETLAFLERQFAHNKVKGVAELDARMPPLPLDRGMMRQVLMNLLLNAQQSIVRDGAITVRTAWDAARKTATLAVTDSGPGVAPEVRDKLFELFATTKAGGGGLGLALARQIVEEHGGRISYESAPGKTTFSVELPG